MLRIVRGNPSEREVAALTAVLVGLAGAPRTEMRAQPRTARSTWADPAARLRDPRRLRPRTWRTSVLPR